MPNHYDPNDRTWDFLWPEVAPDYVEVYERHLQERKDRPRQLREERNNGLNDDLPEKKKPKEEDENEEVFVDEVIRETAKAFLFKIGKETYWYPKSQLKAQGIQQGQRDIEVLIPRWLARAKVSEKK